MWFMVIFAAIFYMFNLCMMLCDVVIFEIWSFIWVLRGFYGVCGMVYHLEEKKTYLLLIWGCFSYWLHDVWLYVANMGFMGCLWYVWQRKI